MAQASVEATASQRQAQRVALNQRQPAQGGRGMFCQAQATWVNIQGSNGGPTGDSQLRLQHPGPAADIQQTHHAVQTGLLE